MMLKAKVNENEYLEFGKARLLTFDARVKWQGSIQAKII